MSAASHEIQGSEVALREWSEPAASRYESAKSIFDPLLAGVLLVVLSPLILLALILVRATSSGSPIYSQRRVGQNGLHFTIYKIRSMYVDSEVHGPRWSLPGDQRVTPIGRFLRWSHLDELPQLINVIRGEMSLVGPRPERPELIAAARARLAALSPSSQDSPGNLGSGSGASRPRYRPLQRPPQVKI